MEVGGLQWPGPVSKGRGWPWEGAEALFPGSMPDGSPWPRITVVTPSYNQGQYIEEAIRSVLLQGYPNLQFIIMDGGSSDQTVDVIRRYEPWLSYWVSERDRGQTHAINKGFAMADGDIVAWINSDDYYFPDTLREVAIAHAENPSAILLGDVEEFSDEAELGVQRMHHVDVEHMLRPMDGSWMWHQPGTFVPKTVLDAAGPLDESLHYAFDKDWMFRMLQAAPVEYMNRSLARFRVHAGAKTQADLDKTMREIFRVNRRHLHLTDQATARSLLTTYQLRLVGLHLCAHSGYEPFFSRGSEFKELLKSPGIIFSAAGLHLLYRLLMPRSLWRSD